MMLLIVKMQTIRMKVRYFLLSLEEHSVYYSNEKQPMYACFCMATGLNKFFHTGAQMGISCIKCVVVVVFERSDIVTSCNARSTDSNVHNPR